MGPYASIRPCSRLGPYTSLRSYCCLWPYYSLWPHPRLRPAIYLWPHPCFHPDPSFLPRCSLLPPTNLLGPFPLKTQNRPLALKTTLTRHNPIQRIIHNLKGYLDLSQIINLKYLFIHLSFMIYSQSWIYYNKMHFQVIKVLIYFDLFLDEDYSYVYLHVLFGVFA